MGGILYTLIIASDPFAEQQIMENIGANEKSLAQLMDNL